MSTFTYFPTIPTPSNDPSVDVSSMQTNSGSIGNWAAVDHVGFNTLGGGFHLQVTYWTKNPPAALPTDPESIAFTANAQSVGGTVLNGLINGAASTIAQNFLANQNGVFPLSPIRAFGTFVTQAATGAVSLVNSFNVSSVVHNPPSPTGSYTVTLVAGCTTGNNVNVFITFSNTPGTISSGITYSFAAGVLTIAPGIVGNGQIVNFLILQV